MRENYDYLRFFNTQESSKIGAECTELPLSNPSTPKKKNTYVVGMYNTVPIVHERHARTEVDSCTNDEGDIEE